MTVVLPAARHGVGMLKTSCLTTSELGTCSQIAILRRAIAAVPASKLGGLSDDRHFAPVRHITAQDVASRCVRPRMTVAAWCGRRCGGLRHPEAGQQISLERSLPTVGGHLNNKLINVWGCCQQNSLVPTLMLY